MDLQPGSMAYTSDGDEVQRSTTIDTYSERFDRIELLLKEQVAGVRSDIYGIAKIMAEVSESVDVLKRAFMSGSSARSGRTSSTTFEERHPLLHQNIDNTFPLDLLSACVGSSMLSMWTKLCLHGQVTVPSTSETNECSDDNCDESNTDHVEVQGREAERYMKGLLFGFLPKHTLKAYAEEDGTDHSQFRARAMKTLLSNDYQREERRVTQQQSNRTGVRSVTPFWLKKHGISPRQVDKYYERRVDNARAGNARDRSSARGNKRGRDGEEGSDNEEVALAVLKNVWMGN
jgi:hypothetical protein